MKRALFAVILAGSLTTACTPARQVPLAEQEKAAEAEIEAGRAKIKQKLNHSEQAAADACKTSVRGILERAHAQDIQLRATDPAANLGDGKYRVRQYVYSSRGLQSYICTADTSDGDAFHVVTRLEP